MTLYVVLWGYIKCSKYQVIIFENLCQNFKNKFKIKHLNLYAVSLKKKNKGKYLSLDFGLN